MIRVLLCLSLWLAFVAPLFPTAQAHALDSHDDEARALFEAGLVAFESQRFESALLYFSRSLELSRRAKLHYNIGITLERLDRPREAAAAYTEYLEELPEADNRDEVEARLAVLHGEAGALPPVSATQAKPEPLEEAPKVATPVPAPKPDKRRPIALALTVGGATLLAGGAVLLGLTARAINKVEDARQDSSWKNVKDDEARIMPLSVAGFAAVGVGAATLAVGSVLLLKKRSTRVDVAALPYGLSVKGAF